MTARYVYKNTIIGNGNLQVIPQEGNFIEIQALHKIYKVEAVMFKVTLSGNVDAIIYLRDIMENTEKMLRNYK